MFLGIENLRAPMNRVKWGWMNVLANGCNQWCRQRGAVFVWRVGTFNVLDSIYFTCNHAVVSR